MEYHWLIDDYLPSMIKLYGGLFSSLPVNVFLTRQAYGVAASAGRLARSTCKSPEGTTWNFPSAKIEKRHFLFEKSLFLFSHLNYYFSLQTLFPRNKDIRYILRWRNFYNPHTFLREDFREMENDTLANIFVVLGIINENQRYRSISIFIACVL